MQDKLGLLCVVAYAEVPEIPCGHLWMGAVLFCLTYLVHINIEDYKSCHKIGQRSIMNSWISQTLITLEVLKYFLNLESGWTHCHFSDKEIEAWMS